MAATTSKNETDAYARHVEEIRGQLQRIEEAVTGDTPDELTWGDVRTLGYVR